MSPIPAKSKAQLRKAYAAKSRGEAWGEEMVAATKTTKGLPARKRKKRKKAK